MPLIPLFHTIPHCITPWLDQLTCAKRQNQVCLAVPGLGVTTPAVSSCPSDPCGLHTMWPSLSADASATAICLLMSPRTLTSKLQSVGQELKQRQRQQQQVTLQAVSGMRCLRCKETPPPPPSPQKRVSPRSRWYILTI